MELKTLKANLESTDKLNITEATKMWLYNHYELQILDFITLKKTNIIQMHKE